LPVKFRKSPQSVAAQGLFDRGSVLGGLVRRIPAHATGSCGSSSISTRQRRSARSYRAHYPLERAADALNAVLLRKVTGKVVLEP
jgi:hypothetical protein